MNAWTRIVTVAAMLGATVMLPGVGLAQQAAPVVPNPDRRDLFQLNELDSYRRFSLVSNFEIVGHSYFRGPWVAPGGPGAAFNTLRICGNVAYVAGYNPTVFGALVVDVSDPAHMEPLAFIPGNPGTRNAYLRADCQRKIVALGHSTSAENLAQPPAGAQVRSGVSFHDVSDPRRPVKLGEWNNPGGLTHGMEMDDRYVYVCGTADRSKRRHEELNVLDYSDPGAPKLVGSYHVMGQREGETFTAMNQLNPNGTQQFVTCHEAIKEGTRLYLAYRDAGVIVLDITDPARPTELGAFDYSPPFNGDPGNPPGCCPGAHTAQPVPHEGSTWPRLLVLTDEHFSCPPGFVRILDISNLRAMQVLSTIHVAGVDDQYDHATGKFLCPPGQQSAHLPYFDPRGHGSLFYQAWYDQGLRAFDISNPFSPKEVGYFISPDFSVPKQVGRHTREAYVDPATSLIYVTDGNGGGLAVLRYIGPIPSRPPVPGAR